MRQHIEKGWAMGIHYQVRVGIRAELCITLIADSAQLSEQEILDLVCKFLKKYGDDEGRFRVERLSDAVVYPDYNNVDPELDPEHILDVDKIRVFDVVKINTTNT